MPTTGMARRLGGAKVPAPLIANACYSTPRNKLEKAERGLFCCPPGGESNAKTTHEETQNPKQIRQPELAFPPGTAEGKRPGPEPGLSGPWTADLMGWPRPLFCNMNCSQRAWVPPALQGCEDVWGEVLESCTSTGASLNLSYWSSWGELQEGGSGKVTAKDLSH